MRFPFSFILIPCTLFYTSINFCCKPGEIIILEGIHGLNPVVSEKLPAHEIYRVFASALTCLNLDDHNRIRTTDVRLLRRVVRDHLFRGTAIRRRIRWKCGHGCERRRKPISLPSRRMRTACSTPPCSMSCRC